MKYFCLVLFLAFAVAGCKPKEKEQVIANQVVAPEQSLITGQIFIVTKGGENVALGDTKVALLDADETGTYFKSKALEWSNALAAAQAKVDQATISYDALYKDDLEKYADAKKYHDNIMQTAPTDSQEWSDADAWSQKLEGEIRDLHELKKSSAEKRQLDEAISAQADLWDEITWPSADYFSPRIDIATTDSEGRFKFVVPKSYSDSDLELLAKGERQAGDENEKYWWMIDVHLYGKKTAEYVLSNDNNDTSGVWGGFWFDDRTGVITNNFDYLSPMEIFADHYSANMEAAKKDRDYQDWLDNLLDGDGK